MVRGNEVQQMEAHVFALRLEVLPIFERKGSPEGVDQFNPDIDVTEQLAQFVERHGETVLLHTVFPKLAAVVEENPCLQQVAVQ